MDAALLELELALTAKAAGQNLEPRQREALTRCLELLRTDAGATPFDASDVDELIHHNEHWRSIRERAAEALETMRISLSEWERVNVPASSFLLIRNAPALPAEKFSPEQFGRAAGEDRMRLCAELEAELSGRLRSGTDFAEAAAQITAELWAMGHDLWNVHRNDERELWAPDSATSPDTMGISVELYRCGRAKVSWVHARIQSAPRSK